MTLHPDLVTALDRAKALSAHKAGTVRLEAASPEGQLNATLSTIVANAIHTRLTEIEATSGFDGWIVACGAAAAIKAWVADRLPPELAEPELKALAWVLTDMPLGRRKQ